MDAFEVHRRLIGDHRTFTEGFVDIHDDRIRRVGRRSRARRAFSGQRRGCRSSAV